MTALPAGSSGVSCWFPNEDTRLVPRRHVGGQSFTRAQGERCFDQPHTHGCGFDGLARHFQCDYFEFWTCPDCGEKTVVFDENDLIRDGGDLPEHEDPDWLDGPPESYPREVA